MYLFLEKGERRERNINLWTGPATRACVLTGNLTSHFAGRHSVHWATPGRARRAKLLMHVINLFIQQLLTFCIRFNQVKDLTRRPLSSIKFWIYVIFLFLCKEEIKFHLVRTTNQRLNTLSVADSQGVDGWGCQGSAPFPNINRLNGSCAVSAQCVPRPLLNAWHPFLIAAFVHCRNCFHQAMVLLFMFTTLRESLWHSAARWPVCTRSL